MATDFSTNIQKTSNFIQKSGSNFNYNDYWLRKDGTLKYKTFFSRCIRHFRGQKTLKDMLAALENVNSNTALKEYQIIPAKFLLSRGTNLDAVGRKDCEFRKKCMSVFNSVSEIKEAGIPLVEIDVEKKQLTRQQYPDGYLSARLRLLLGDFRFDVDIEFALANLHKGPTPYQSIQELFSSQEIKEIQKIDLGEMSNMVLQHFDGEDAAYISLNAMGQAILTKEKSKDIGNRDQFYEELTFVMQGITYFLKKKKPKEQKEILQSIAAHSVCKPTWLEHGTALLKQLKGIKGQNECEELIFTYCQEVKEDLILVEWPENAERLQGTAWENQWHGLNWMRAHLGEELGLNVQASQFDKLKDGFKLDGEFQRFPFLEEEAKALFLEDFTAERLIQGVMERLNKMAKTKGEDLIGGYLMTLPTLGILEEPLTFIIEHLYDYNEGKITREGVVFILKSLELLSLSQ